MATDVKFPKLIVPSVELAYTIDLVPPELLYMRKNVPTSVLDVESVGKLIVPNVVLTI
jgi:hypothetical protein